MQVYETWPVENDPDKGPQKPPKRGNWTWWRTGPHPMGRFLAMEWGGNFSQELADNRAEFPIMQDQALGESSDFGGFNCHACGYSSDGYPEPNHMTKCDGVCGYIGCTIHGAGGRQKALDELSDAYDLAISRGLSKEEIAAHIRGL